MAPFPPPGADSGVAPQPRTVYLVTDASDALTVAVASRLADARPDAVVMCVSRAGPSAARADVPRRLMPPYATVPGDLASPSLGLHETTVAWIAARERVHVVHAAVSPALDGVEDGDVDVGADAAILARLKNVLAFAGRIRSAGPVPALHLITSIAVAGDAPAAAGAPFTEAVVDAASTTFGYRRGRAELEAETLARRAYPSVRVYRPGLVLGSVALPHLGEGAVLMDRATERLCAWFHALRGLPTHAVTLPMFRGNPIPLASLEYCAAAIAGIAAQDDVPAATFHVVDPVPPTIDALLNAFTDAVGSGPRFSAAPFDALSSLAELDSDKAWSRVPILRDAPATIGGNVLNVPPGVARFALSGIRVDDANARAALARAPAPVRPVPLVHTARRLMYDFDSRRIAEDDAVTPAQHAAPGAARAWTAPPLAALAREVAGKVVIVTGASEGIGRTLSKQLGRAGATVVVAARNRARLEELRDEINARGPGKAHAVVCDVTSDASVRAAVAETVALFSRVDVLVNNAGVSVRRSVEYQAAAADEYLTRDFMRVQDVNGYGTLRMTLAVLPHMRERRRGQIVNTSSIAVLFAPPRFGAYLATKAWVDGFVRSVGSEVACDNVFFSQVFVPLTRTKMVVSDSTDYEHVTLYTPEQSSGLIERAIVTKERRVQPPSAGPLWTLHTAFPSAMDGVLNLMYRFEPEMPPKGLRPRSAEATGDAKQVGRAGQAAALVGAAVDAFLRGQMPRAAGPPAGKPGSRARGSAGPPAAARSAAADAAAKL